MQPVLTPADINGFLDEVFPELNVTRRVFSVDEVRAGGVTVRCEAGPEHLRPGGTVSGPTLMTLADIACWVCVLAHVGPSALTVTTHLSIDFLSKPVPGLLFGRARLLKLGKRLAVAACDIGGPGEGAVLFAHASATYSIPPRDQVG